MAELIQEKKFEPAIIKIIILGLLGLSATYCFGHYLSLLLINFHQTRFLLFSLLAVAIFLIIFFFQVIFIQHKWQSNLIIFLEAIVLFFSLSGLSIFSSKLILISVFLFFVFLILPNFLARKEIDNNLKIDFLKINRIVFNGAITAFSIFWAIIIGNVIFFNFLNQPSFDLQKFITPFLEMSEKTLPSDFNKNILKGFVEQQINSDAQLKLLPEAQKEKIIEESLKQIEKEMGGKFDINTILKNQETQTVFKELSDKFLNIPPKIKVYIAVILGLIIFSILKGIGIVLTWPLTFITFLFYELLLATNFAKISLEQRDKEVLSL